MENSLEVTQPAATAPAPIRLMKYYATNGQHKARVWYSKGSLVSGRECVTIYAKDYSERLVLLFGAEVENGTDMMTDYFEKDRVRIFPDSPLYAAALALATKGA